MSSCTCTLSGTIQQSRRRGSRAPQPSQTVEKASGPMFEDQKKRKVCDDDTYELLDYEQLPEYMKENEYIRGHYRSELPFKQAFLSLFHWHNETLNIWTHLIGFFVFLGLTAIHLRDTPFFADLFNNFNFTWPMTMSAAENVSNNASNFYGAVSSVIKLQSTTTDDPMLLCEGATNTDAPRWPFLVFMCGSMFCLLCSSVCHLFCCHSRDVGLLLWRMDYVGIAIMIVTSFFPPIYYIFLCQPHWQLLYLSTISLMGIAIAVILFAPHFSTGPFRSYRAFLFLAMGFSGIVPAVHATVANWDEPQRPVMLAYESAMALLYVTGTAFYVSRVPERWKPGMFDLTGHSHQIFHVFVVAGALAHYAAALVLMEWRDRVGCVTN